MKKLFLILFLGIIVASCGGGETAKPTEIVTETPSVEVEEVSQTETTETTYFDNVFQEDLDGFCGGHLYLTKGMKYFRIEDGKGGMQNITYGTYSINNNIIEIVSERSDISRKLEISKNGNEIWLIEINEEYPIKFKLVENDKEIINEFTSIFGSKITESSQNSSTTVNIPEDAVFISGTWYFDGSLPDLGPARITLSLDNYGIFEIHAKTGYGSEIIMGYGGYYVKGNTVYTSFENTNNYEATMKITSNGDIIFGEITSNGDIIFGEKKFKKYRRR